MARRKINLLIVDDEKKFIENMSSRLKLRGLSVHAVNRGEDAIRQVRRYDYDVVLLDLKMPGMSGEETLKEIKKLSGSSLVIILTGHASFDSATETGRLDAYAYCEKTMDFEDLLQVIDKARQDRINVLIREDEIVEPKPSMWQVMWGVTNYRPLFIITGFMVFLLITALPAPQSLLTLIGHRKTSGFGEKISGYANYRDMNRGDTIADYYARYTKLIKGKSSGYPVEDAAFKVKVMAGLLFLAAFFWGTGAIPIGFTAILIGVVMYWFRIMPPEMVAQSYLKDSVLFIFGVLAMSVGIAKTGLDRRIGVLLLGLSSSLRRFLFIFCPLFAVTASFISEHALVAFISPIMLVVYMAAIKTAGLKEDKNLALVLLLIVTLTGNIGGPGSTSAGGRNAIMLGILKDYGAAPSYLEWIKYGLPFVPVMAIVIALYFYIVFRKKIKVTDINIASVVKKESNRLWPMLRNEYLMAIILLLVIAGWVFLSDRFGMGGPVLFGLLLMSVFRIVRWKDITHISWDVVALYAAATALGKGLAVTGTALYIADGFISILPEEMKTGTGLAVATSLFSGVITNLMSDGATVSAIGPITVPMALIAETHPWMIGFATAFASSFAHALIIGTPNNAIVYAVAINPDTGKRLVTLSDFAKHGTAVWALSLLVLWGWLFAVYWPWIGFPAVQ